MITEILARIENDDFCAGLYLENDVVIEAAPILGYMKKQRWSRSRVREYCKDKLWKVSVVWRIERREPTPDPIIINDEEYDLR